MSNLITKIAQCALATALLTGYLIVSAQDANAVTMDGVEVPEETVEMVQAAIQYNGFVCDAIDDMRLLVWESGYSINCDDFTYRYELINEGGYVKVKLQ